MGSRPDNRTHRPDFDTKDDRRSIYHDVTGEQIYPVYFLLDQPLFHKIQRPSTSFPERFTNAVSGNGVRSLQT
jgi:hypothetical protein